MANTKTTPVRAKVMVHLGGGKVMGPRDKTWDCPDDILGTLLEENAVEIVEVSLADTDSVDDAVQAIMDEGNKGKLEAELKWAGQSFDASARKHVLASQLLAVRCDMVEAIKGSMTVDEIKDELEGLGQEWPEDALEADLAGQLLAARRSAELGA
ncbi:MAG: hypothetical protein KKD73_01690 [Proteobacteria bacterium]|nr:hypothetical protein [Pseudomonadota bacterium]MBU1640083.1 hypothetical protein [Pseudomonadota bacterium]